MRSPNNTLIFVLATILTILSLCTVSCEKQLQAKLIITEQNFVLRQDTDKSFTIDVNGKIKNVGEVDVKKVAVTGYCRSCGEEWIPGRWFVSSIEKTPIQKDVINFIAAGDEESFSFTEVANLLLTQGQKSPELPEKLEVVIESFETVQK